MGEFLRKETVCVVDVKLCLFASTPELAGLGWAVKPLIGSPAQIAEHAIRWGYDGFEFMPNPRRMPEPSEMEAALRQSGAVMPVVSSAVIYFQGDALLHRDRKVRRRAAESFQRILAFAGHFKANVGLGASRGSGISDAAPGELEAMADEVFRELAEHAEKAGAVVMLEPAEPGYSKFINTVEQAMWWVERIASPFFSVMLDTFQLAESEASFALGVKAARGTARHIHLYEPSHWPPGVLPELDRYNWPEIAEALARGGFQGSGSICLAPEGDPEPAARKAAAFLRRLFSGTTQPS